MKEQTAEYLSDEVDRMVGFLRLVKSESFRQGDMEIKRQAELAIDSLDRLSVALWEETMDGRLAYDMPGLAR